jgi:uncharacterized protein YggE
MAMKPTLLPILLLAALPAAAQVSPPLRPVPPVPNTVTVLGEAVVYAPPDRARLRFGVETEGATAEATFRQHEQEVAAVLTAVRRLGIPDRDIELEWVGLNDRRDDRGQPDGYTAARMVTVTTDSLRLVPELVAAIVDAGGDRLAGLDYYLENDDLFENQALEAAFDRAEAKARELALAAGARLGPVVAVAEQGVQPPMPLLVRGAAESYAMDAVPGAYSTGQSEVRAFVVVTFALEAR